MGFAHGAQSTREPLGERSEPLAAWPSVQVEVARGPHEAFDRDLPAHPEEKAKGELPSLGKIVLALAVGDAWQAADDAALRLVSRRDAQGSNAFQVVPNARAPPPGY
jgi:hypothetical protein